MRSMNRNTAVAMTSVLVGLLGNTFAAEPKFDAAQVEFFEKKVRPILVNHCYECHSGIAKEVGRSGLRLDSREAVLKGGDSGPAIILSKPDESRMIQFVRHQGKKMPGLKKPKLKDDQIATLAKWVEIGAPWSTVKVKPKEETYDWANVRKHWAWLPVRKGTPPPIKGHALLTRLISLWRFDYIR